MNKVDELVSYLTIPTVQDEKANNIYTDTRDKTTNVQVYFNKLIDKIEGKLNKTISLIQYINSNKFTSLVKGSSYTIYEFKDEDELHFFHETAIKEIINMLDRTDNVLQEAMIITLNKYIDILADVNNLDNDVSDLRNTFSDMNSESEMLISRASGHIRSDIDNGGGFKLAKSKDILIYREEFTKAVRKYYKTLFKTKRELESLRERIKHIKVETRVSLKDPMDDLYKNISKALAFNTKVKFLVKTSTDVIFNGL